jgi:uncharacterized protein
VSGALVTLGVGLVSGLFSGAFGIGGGVVTTPAIRLLLGASALVAVGTPLPVIIPSALTGALSYWRRGSLDARAALVCGLAGSASAIAGALATRAVGGTTVLLLTALLIGYTAIDMILQVFRPPRLGLEASEERDAFAPEDGSATPLISPPAPAVWKLVIIGLITGSYSGLMGLGGGFVLVPLLTRWIHFDIKRAIGTSLAAIAILAVPGTVMHSVLGNVDWRMAAGLIVGVVPGAWLGSRIALGASDRAVRIAFAVVLLLVGGVLGGSELGWLR